MKYIIGFLLILDSNISLTQNLTFNQALTSQIYPDWINYDTQIQINDVVNLRGGWNGFSNFCDQVFSNVSVVLGPSGKWYIYGYGDHKLSETKIGDASWLIARDPDGKYDLVPQCHYNP